MTRNNVVISGAPEGTPDGVCARFRVRSAHVAGCRTGLSSRMPHGPVRSCRCRRVGLTAYEYARYDSLDGYADDVVEICRTLDLWDAVFVGNSVSAVTFLSDNRKDSLTSRSRRS